MNTPVYHMPRPKDINGKECWAFAWIGQPFSACDNCGQPYWLHTHEERASERGIGYTRRKVIDDPTRDAVRRKWGSS